MSFFTSPEDLRDGSDEEMEQIIDGFKEGPIADGLEAQDFNTKQTNK